MCVCVSVVQIVHRAHAPGVNVNRIQSGQLLSYCRLTPTVGMLLQCELREIRYQKAERGEGGKGGEGREGGRGADAGCICSQRRRPPFIILNASSPGRATRQGVS